MDEHDEALQRIRSRILDRLSTALDRPGLTIGEMKTAAAVLEDVADLVPGTGAADPGTGILVRFLGDADEFSR